ncbi:signal peptidase I [Candidatus Woesearchaeota archaeon]|nr:signal peptidase I [Candidatus Woesearchaeota archaeon]
MAASFLPFSVHTVRGHSMQPTINDGERVVVLRWAYLFSAPKAGDVVVFKGSDGKDYAKRVSAAVKNEFFVKGDNEKDSRDSRSFGAVKKTSVVGKVVMTY